MSVSRVIKATNYIGCMTPKGTKCVKNFTGIGEVTLAFVETLKKAKVPTSRTLHTLF